MSTRRWDGFLSAITFDPKLRAYLRARGCNAIADIDLFTSSECNGAWALDSGIRFSGSLGSGSACRDAKMNGRSLESSEFLQSGPDVAVQRTGAIGHTRSLDKGSERSFERPLLVPLRKFAMKPCVRAWSANVVTRQTKVCYESTILGTFLD